MYLVIDRYLNLIWPFFQYFKWWNGYQWNNNANECWILAIWRCGWKWNGSLSWKGKGGLFWEFIFISLIDHKTVRKIVSCKVQNNFELVFGHSKLKFFKNSDRILWPGHLFLPWTAESGCVFRSSIVLAGTAGTNTRSAVQENNTCAWLKFRYGLCQTEWKTISRREL